MPKISGSQRKFHSVEMALNKKINGNGKVYKIYEIPFSHRKNHPVLQISPTFLLVVLRQKANRCLCSPRMLLFYKKPLSYTFEHRSIKSQRFHFEEHFLSTRQAFSSMRKNMPRSSSADILGVTKKAHMRANMSQGKICKKGN